jgi:hypothetical protein
MARATDKTDATDGKPFGVSCGGLTCGHGHSFGAT